MPKDSKTSKKSKAKKPVKSPFKGKVGNKTQRIQQRAQMNAQNEAKEYQIGPTQAHPNALPIIYGSEDKHVHKISRGLYTDELLPIVEKLAKSGATNQEIAESLGIGNKTFYEWRHRYPHFAQALNKYRGVINSLVENAFIKNCLGYGYVEEQMAGNGMVRPVTKWHPGETRAQSLYLFNHMGDRYKNKVETVHSLGEGMGGMAFALKAREE